MEQPFVTICMGCHPGVTQIAGVTLSHGWCRYHGLEAMADAGLATPAELVELYARRYWWALLLAALAAFTLGVGARARTTDKNERRSAHRPTPAVRMGSDFYARHRPANEKRQAPVSTEAGHRRVANAQGVRTRSLRRFWDAVALNGTGPRSNAGLPCGLNGSGACWRRPVAFAWSVKGVGRAARVAPARAATEDRVEVPTQAPC